MDAEFFPPDLEQKLRNALSGGNSSAWKWPNRLPGNWFYSSSRRPLPESRRKKGMIIAYVNAAGDFGHAAVIEEISEDGKFYKRSERGVQSQVR